LSRTARLAAIQRWASRVVIRGMVAEFQMVAIFKLRAVPSHIILQQVEVVHLAVGFMGLPEQTAVSSRLTVLPLDRTSQEANSSRPATTSLVTMLTLSLTRNLQIKLVRPPLPSIRSWVRWPITGDQP